MGQLLRTILDDWGQGVITSMEADQVPPGAYIRGYNVALISVGGGKAAIMKRKGCSTLNATQVTGASAIVGQYEFKMQSGGSFTTTHLLVSDNGRLDKVSTGGTLTTIDASAFTSSSSQEHLPDFATANNLAFIVNGIEAKKYNGTALQVFGIVEPSTAPTLADSGVAGNHNGTYEARVTFYNSATGHESSAGPTSATVTVTSKKIDWSSIPVSSDSQVTSRRLFLRNTATQSNFYLVTTINDNSTTTYQSNLLDSSLTLIGPDRDENDPPPSGVRYLTWHRSRMFAADSTDLFFSKPPSLAGVPLPEAFDPENIEPINPDDGQAITGLASAFDLLVIFKSNSVYALVGDDPDSWSVIQIDAKLGCVAHRGIIRGEGALFWWSDQGPVSWDGSGTPQLIGPALISATIAFTNLSADPTAQGKICGAADLSNSRIMWALPELSQTRNTIILPFNYRIRRWESDRWDPLDVASLAVVDDSNGQPTVMIGGYAGQTFKWWDTFTDGVPSGTVSGTFVAATASHSTITDAGAAFLNTGGKLTERKVTVLTAAGVPVQTSRPRISSNTGTVLTLASNVTGLTPGLTYTYHIGGPAMDFETAWLTDPEGLKKKRYQFLYLQMRPTNAISDILVDTYYSYNLTPSSARSFSLDAATSLWDVSLWDVATWDSNLQQTSRFRLGHTGIAMMTRLRHFAPATPVDLLKIGVQAEELSERLG